MKTIKEMDYKKTTVLLAILLILATIFIFVLTCSQKGYYKKSGYGKMYDSKMMMNHDMGDMQNMNGMQGHMNMMNMGLQGKTGETLDKAFLAEMIVHHQGALDMANTLKAGTTRPELQKLADNIIMAQTKEINQMRAWQKEWFNQ